MASQKRSVLFERQSNAKSNEINRTSSTETASDQSGIFPAERTPARGSGPRPDFFSPEFMEWYVESLVRTKI